MDEWVTLRLKRSDVGQMVDGLEQRMIVWRGTTEYLRTGSTKLCDVVEECSDPEEARAIAEWYLVILTEIRMQLAAQG